MRLPFNLHFHLAAILLLLLLSTASATAQEFDRGDPNVDGLYDIGDPIFNLGYLFANGPLNCLDAQDPNDGGMVRSKKNGCVSRESRRSWPTQPLSTIV